MRLEDLPRINELAAALKRLDEFAGPATLSIGEMLMELDADETADFVEWKRGRINAELRPLTDAGAPPVRQRDNPAEREEAPSDGNAPPAAAPRSVARKPAKPAPRMTRAQALAEAKRRILDPFEKELRANGGYLADPEAIALDLAIYHDKRRADIAQLATELMRGPVVKVCVVCGEPATTVKAGQDYCTKDAKAVQVDLPEAVRLVA